MRCNPVATSAERSALPPAVDGPRRHSPLNRAAMAVWRRRNQKFVRRIQPGHVAPHLELSLARFPRLGVDWALLQVARRRHAGEDVPWVTEDALRLLETVLLPTDTGLEFGSGASTVWFARHAAQVRSVEASPEWFDAVQPKLDRAHLDNARVTLASRDLGEDSPAHRDAYVNAYPELAPGSLDWVFVDGEYRDECAMRAIDLLKCGGLLILDNANSYLPGPSRSPWRVSAPGSPMWHDVADRLSSWRMAWTTNGLWDTALWVKPF
jgi:predicted O-methyltransferase YrrM